MKLMVPSLRMTLEMLQDYCRCLVATHILEATLKPLDSVLWGTELRGKEHTVDDTHGVGTLLGRRHILHEHPGGPKAGVDADICFLDALGLSGTQARSSGREGQEQGAPSPTPSMQLGCHIRSPPLLSYSAELHVHLPRPLHELDAAESPIWAPVACSA